MVRVCQSSITQRLPFRRCYEINKKYHASQINVIPKQRRHESSVLFPPYSILLPVSHPFPCKWVVDESNQPKKKSQITRCSQKTRGGFVGGHDTVNQHSVVFRKYANSGENCSKTCRKTGQNWFDPGISPSEFKLAIFSDIAVITFLFGPSNPSIFPHHSPLCFL